jgi:HK97 family phage prohead protease
MPPTANVALLEEYREARAKISPHRGLTFKDSPAALRFDDDDEFAAYFARFGNVDRASDVIVPGAFVNLDQFAQHDGFIGVNHRLDDPPIAYPTSAVQDRVGLLVTGRFHSTPKGQEIRQILRERTDAGLDCKCSIGYKVVQSEPGYVDGRSVRMLTKLQLYECSFVGIACNNDAKLVSVKYASRRAGTLPAPPFDILMTLVCETKGGTSKLPRKNRPIIRALKDLLDTDDDDPDARALRAFLDQYTRDQDAGLLLEADGNGGYEDVSNTAVDDEASQRAIEARPRNTYPPRRSEEVIDQGGKGPDAPNDPRRAAGNALPQVGSPTAPLMAGRGKSTFIDPYSPIQQAADRRRVKEILDARAAKAWGTSAEPQIELPPAVWANELASLAVKQREAYHASLRHR